MSAPGGSAKPLSQKALRLLVTDMAGKIDRLEQVVEQLHLDNSNLRLENQALKDEIARLKNLPPRCFSLPTTAASSTAANSSPMVGKRRFRPNAVTIGERPIGSPRNRQSTAQRTRNE
ncbi:hypothetical protein RE429_30500 (plasmid) [Microvirga sp. M2]